MKKNLLALAALTLVSGAAFAQSSVTLYGVADVGIGKMGGKKTEMISGTDINHTTSYIGFRGIEDLGGGLKAGFRLEQYVNMENGATASANGFVGSETYGRAANLWLEGGFGQFKMGRFEAPSYNATLAWSIVGDANYLSALQRYAAVGRAVRTSSQFGYKTPVFGGFSAEVAFVAKGDRNDNKAKYDLNVIYDNGPISAGFAYNKIQDAKANYALGAKYNFGMFALSASYYDIRNLRKYTLPVGASFKLAGYSIGGSVKFDNITLAIELQRQRKNEVYYQNTTRKFKKYTEGTLAATYALSKRTFIYADYLRLENKNNYGVGIQHKF